MPATARKAAPARSHRNALTAKIHIAKKDLGLDEDTYRDMIENRYGKRSSKDLSINQLVDLVEHLKGQGFKPKPKRAPGKVMPSEDREKLIRKIRALWVSLHHLGVLRDASEEALASFARRVTGGKETGIADLAWLDGNAAYKVVEALKAMAERDGGVCWEPYRMSSSAGPVIEHRPRCRVLEAQWRTMAGMKLAQISDTAALAVYARRVANDPAHKMLSQMREADQDLVIANLGAQIRKRLDELGFETVQDWRKAQ